jgi:undecaprenyl-diphosphatase
MTWWHAVVLGIVEGLTEFLPVSSTGHLILTSRLLRLPQTEFLKSFEVAIQLGSILAVVVVYWRSFLRKPEVLKRVLMALAPTLAVGFLLYKVVKQYLFSNETVILWSLVLGGIALILFDRWHREGPDSIGEIEKIPYSKSFLIGLAQAVAVVPGVSRAGATILGGLALGLKRAAIVEFSFLLAVPTILAATALDLFKNRSAFAGADWNLLLIGSAVSFAVAMAVIRFFIRYAQKGGFTVFGVYRILAAVAFWGLVR